MKISKTRGAFEQMEDAARLYFDGRYISCLALAGGAEEVLGEACKLYGLTPMAAGPDQASHLRDALVRLSCNQNVIKEEFKNLNSSKNAIKHYRKQENPFMTLDDEGEARAMLGRALANYGTLHDHQVLTGNPGLDLPEPSTVMLGFLGYLRHITGNCDEEGSP